MSLSKEIKAKLNKLNSYLKNKKIIVSFSGGVDSSLLAFLSKKSADKTLLVTEKSILFPDDDIEYTIKFAKKYDIPHLIIKGDPFKDESFFKNTIKRCYHCKRRLYTNIIKIKEEKNYDVIIDGTNADDVSDFRPGMQALKELNIKTPYIDFNINKNEIREISKYYNLKTHSKPSMACYASRVQYDLLINEERINKIKQAENYLKNSFNLTQVRVRIHEQDLARIEFLIDDFQKILTLQNLKLIKTKFKDMGFCYITIDIEGFRSGSLNEALNLKKE
ncbi:MAG: ATP-dependent sacrificial sulfur transferase LarE [Promethearchaeota archaeon]|nr:MAG: ATP-dependent sacrificial sulfur transferase LarE [Candidatus Lokiarchaeota archaeon]